MKFLLSKQSSVYICIPEPVKILSVLKSITSIVSSQKRNKGGRVHPMYGVIKVCTSVVIQV